MSKFHDEDAIRKFHKPGEEVMKPNKLHIGCGQDYKDGYCNLDRSPDVRADIYFDLETCSAINQLPFEEDTFDEIFAAHTLEHITNILPLMEELYRVAKPGCVFLIRVPYGSTASAFDDPTHVRQFFPTSLLYFGQPAYWRADYGYRGDWRVEECGLFVRDFVKERVCQGGMPLEFAVHHLFGIVDELVAALIAVKPRRAREAALQEIVKPVIEIIPVG